MKLAIAAAALLAIAGVASAARADIVEGNPSSPVKVLIYEDLQCPDCATFRNTLDESSSPKYGARSRLHPSRFPAGQA